MSEENATSENPNEILDLSGLSSLVQESNSLVKNFQTRMDTLEAQIRDGKVPSLSGGNAKDENTIKKGLTNYLKGIILQDKSLIPDEYKNAFLSEGASTDIHASVIPVEMFNQILSLALPGGVLLRNARILPMIRQSMTVPKHTTFPTFAFVTEGSAKSISNPGFSSITLTRQDGGFIVVFSRQLLEDAAFDLSSFVTMIAAQVFARAVDTHGFTGTTPIVGLSEAATVNTYQTLTAGNVNIADMVYEDILALIGAVPEEYNLNPKFFMNQATYYTVIRAMKAAGSKEFIVPPYLLQNKMLEGRAVEFVADMPAPSADANSGNAGKKVLYYGDFLQQVLIGLRNSFTVEFSNQATVGSYNLWEMGLVGLKFGASFDIKFPYPAAIGAVKTATV